MGGGGVYLYTKFNLPIRLKFFRKKSTFQIFNTSNWSSITAVILENVTKIYQIIVICNISSFIELQNSTAEPYHKQAHLPPYLFFINLNVCPRDLEKSKLLLLRWTTLLLYLLKSVHAWSSISRIPVLNDLVINQQKRSSLSSPLAPREERRAMLEALSKGMTLASQPISSVDFLSFYNNNRHLYKLKRRFLVSQSLS